VLGGIWEIAFCRPAWREPAGVLATSLSGDPAAGFCEDASARVYEHPALLRLLDLSLGLVLSAICPRTAMSKCLETGNLIAKCDCARSYAAPAPPIRRQVSIGRHAVRAAPERPICPA
jgi:hypothetical protein